MSKVCIPIYMWLELIAPNLRKSGFHKSSVPASVSLCYKFLLRILTQCVLIGSSGCMSCTAFPAQKPWCYQFYDLTNGFLAREGLGFFLGDTLFFFLGSSQSLPSSSSSGSSSSSSTFSSATSSSCSSSSSSDFSLFSSTIWHNFILFIYYLLSNLSALFTDQAYWGQCAYKTMLFITAFIYYIINKLFINLLFFGKLL